MSRRNLMFCTLIGLVMPLSAALAGQTVCPCTADTSIASAGSEVNQNSGTAEKIKIKGRENQLLMRFDLSGIPKDAAIQSAALRVKMTMPNFRLNQVAVSSVSVDWVEGTGRTVDGEGEEGAVTGACFNWAGPKTAWTQPDSTVCDVTWGNGGSVENYGFAKAEGDNWWTIPVDPRVVAAMRADSFGLIVQEESGWWAPKNANIFVFSREKKGAAPTLTVEWAAAEAAAPSPVKDIKVSTDNLDDGQAVLEFTCGGAGADEGAALGYDIRCLAGKKITAENWAAAKVVPRWETPRPKPAGQRVKAWITDLEAGQGYSFAVAAYDQSGNRSAIAATDVVKIPKTDAPRLAYLKPLELPPGSPVEVAGKMALWATDELTKVDPVTGQVLDGDGYKATQARKGSHVWDGQNHAIRLTAAKGEVVAFNLVIEALDGSLEDVVVRPDDLVGPKDGKIPAARFTPHRVWYVQDKKGEKTTYYGDPVPVLDKPLQIPAPDNKVTGQKNQSVYVDLAVPHGIPAGVYRGQLAVESAAGTGAVNVQVHVLDLEMPDALSYIIELNAYGTGDDRDAWLAMHRLAHLHRLGYNVLAYGHCESVTVPFMPKIEGEGAEAKITDWSAYDEWMGPLLDGSAFADLPRGAVPIPHFYLPFHENYPEKIRKHYAKPEFFENKPLNKNGVLDYEAWKDNLAATDVDIRIAFDKTWRDEAEAIARQYRQHFIDKGWTRTQFQIFCNNKHYFREPKTQNPNERGGYKLATSLWTLDEPSFGRDFRALAYIYSVFHKPLVGEPLNVLSRGDVSRPEWQGDRCDGSLDLAVVSSALYRYQTILQRQMITKGEKLWFYGGGNSPAGDNAGLAAVYIKTWTMGVDGGLAYWTSVAEQADAWDRPQSLAVVLTRGGKGYAGPVATTRLKAERRAEQDIELMNMLAHQPGWNRNRVARAVAAAVNLTSKTVARGADDPGQTSFKGLHASDLAKIRYALEQEILAAQKPKATLKADASK
jgi:hypothetical protein